MAEGDEALYRKLSINEVFSTTFFQDSYLFKGETYATVTANDEISKRFAKLTSEDIDSFYDRNVSNCTRQKHDNVYKITLCSADVSSESPSSKRLVLGVLTDP